MGVGPRRDGPRQALRRAQIIGLASEVLLKFRYRYMPALGLVLVAVVTGEADLGQRRGRACAPGG